VPRYAAFLRAINVSNRRASGERLRLAFEELDLENVASFRNSGNVIFESASKDPEKLATLIERGLKDALGFNVPVFLRTGRQIRAIAGHEPFPARAVKTSKGRLQVALLANNPPAAARRRVLALAAEPDRLALRGRELYWLPSGGTQDSGLDMKAIDDALGPNTVRTMGTIEQIAGKHFAD
jgi:uncharacterized protein (DUF1697 family)